MKQTKLKTKILPKTKYTKNLVSELSADTQTVSELSFPIVGVGASAGGLEALTTLLKRLSEKIGLAIVIIQHLDPTHESDLAKILGRSTSLSVSEIKDGTRPQPDHIYLLPPNYNLILAHGVFKLSVRSNLQKYNLPIDLFFQSLAEEQKNKSIGVILSGTGTDGTQGLLAIKTEGGITFAQEPQSAKFTGMPSSAIESGAVDFVLTPEAIADELVKISRYPLASLEFLNVEIAEKETPGLKLSSHDKALNKIFMLLRKNTHIDFSYYKRSTILRRLSRRLLILKMEDLENYAVYLENHPEEAKLLFADILIHVTRFFRDPDVYESLKNKVLPEYIKNRDHTGPFRVWVPGCSTGEEAYSIAIILTEYLDESGLHIPLQIFASDISEHALKRARAGIYSDIENDVSKDRLKKFFEKVDGSYRVGKRIRETCLFSKHDVTSDPPFAKLDLISCRNVLIYFTNDLQKRILPVFHYALKPNGILLLGHSESIGDFANLFALVEKSQKIHRKKNITTPLKMPLTRTIAPVEKVETPQLASIATRGKYDVQKEAERIAIHEYAPPSVVINDSFDVLQVRGRTSPFLELPQGQVSLNLLKMAHPEIISELRTAIKNAHTKNVTVKKIDLHLRDKKEDITFNLKVVPLNISPDPKDRCFIVFFEEAAPAPMKPISAKEKANLKKTKAGEKSTDIKQQIKKLQSQLTASQEYQRSLIEDYETSQEDLTASNEELQSANEELQSTNEELETAKEELQSTNEELTTVNDELNTRNTEMIQLSNDLTNLLSSTEIPIVMVGPDVKIRRFTPKAGKMLKLIPTDVGRSIGDLKPDIGVLNLDELVAEVMDTMATKELETQDHEGIWYRLQIRPYRTAENKIDGAVIALINIDTIKKAGEELRIAHEDLKTIIDTVPTPLLVINTDRTVKIANKIFYDKFQVKRTETEGHQISELGNGQWNIPALLNILDKTLNERIRFNDFEVEHTFPNIGNKIMSLNATSAQLSGSKTTVALLSITDVTDIMRTERMLKTSEEKYRNLLSSTYDGIIVLRKNGTIEFANPKLEEMFGYDKGELLNRNYDVLVRTEDRLKHADLHGQYVLNPTQREMAKSRNVTGLRKDGSEFPISVYFSPFKSNSEMLINCTVRNISEQIKIEETRKNLQLKEKELLIEAEKNNRTKDEFLATLSHELRTPLTAILGWAQELRSATLSPNAIEKGLAVIERSAHAQEQLINDLLDISRIQSSKLSLDMQVIDLVKVLNLAIDSIQKSAEKKTIRVEKNITPATCMVFADSIRLQQVFWNLLSNAIKFTPDNGKISISLTLVDTPNGKRVRIQIADTGLGIRPDFLPYVFQRFSQADSSTARIYSGLGLGLAISRSLVEMQNGKITAESKGTGQGTTFTIILPLAAAKETPKEKIRASADQQNIPAKLTGIKVLAVDDNEDNRVLFSIILKSLGAVVQVAESVAEALKILTEFKPDIILSDISMPVEDGYSLLRKIREREAASNEIKIPVVALTAHAGDEDVKRVLAAGFSAHVAKPVEKTLLSHVIAELAKPGSR